MTDFLDMCFCVSSGATLAVLAVSALLLKKTSLLSADECFRGCVKLFLGTASLAVIFRILSQLAAERFQ